MITLYKRKPFDGQYSIESCFNRLESDFRRLGVRFRARTAPAHSSGLIGRVRILCDAFAERWRENTLTHVTGDIYFAALAAPRPVVITVHDLEMLRRTEGLKRTLLKTLWIDWPSRKADAVTTVSAETRRRLLDACPRLDKRKVHVVPNSVSDDFFPFPKDFPSDRPQILQVGTKPNKNVERLIEAVRPLNCELTIIGSETAHLNNLLDRMQVSAKFMTNLNDRQIVEAYRSSDILAFVSLEEGFGLPIIEAQRTGRPVVTSNISAMPEVAGDGACLVDPYDVQSIRQGIERVISDADYRRQLVEAGFKNANRFDRNEIAQLYLDIYQHVGAEISPCNA